MLDDRAVATTRDSSSIVSSFFAVVHAMMERETDLVEVGLVGCGLVVLLLDAKKNDWNGQWGTTHHLST